MRIRPSTIQPTDRSPLALSLRKSARLEAEEETHSVELFTGAAASHRIVVDPIDGTLHFYLAGRGYYAVMAGFAIHGRYEAALVALPREGLRLEGPGVSVSNIGLGSHRPWNGASTR